MKENCLDIGTIQAFLDSEVSHEESARIANHIAVCDSCTLAVAEAETESAMVFSTLEAEYNSLVPTQRLWTKINTAIESEREQDSVWHRVRAFVSTALLSPSFAGAAAILIMVGLASIWFSGSSGPAETPSGPAIAMAPKTASTTPANPAQASGPVDVITSPAQYSGSPSEIRGRAIAGERGFQAVKASYSTAADLPRAVRASANAASLTIPGEDSYLKTIESLEKTSDLQKDAVMRPSERIAYERNMAVVNDSIRRVREQVRRNPRNEAAKEVLYSSYQNKIDLLNSISQKEELVASLEQ
jgi:hypothetical protein